MKAAPARTIVLGATVPTTVVAFLMGQIRFLAGQGWRVHVVTSPGPELPAIRREVADLPGVTVHGLPMHRKPSLLADISALRAWTRLIKEIRPDVVMSGTPKAGLLGMLAARRARVPRRVYLLRGLRLEGLDGPSRSLGTLVEKVTCRASTSIVCVSASLQREAISRGLAARGKFVVLGSGSSNGVDTRRFRPASGDERERARASFGLGPDDLVVGYAGRLVTDKGIADLLEAMSLVSHKYPNVRLLVAGGEDSADPLPVEVARQLATGWVEAVGVVEEMPDFYRAIDVFCLPSLREGFPNVVLEAAATAVPVVTTTATGCIDSVIPGRTGLTVLPGDAASLAEALCKELGDPGLRWAHGAAGRDRVVKEFESVVVWGRVLDYLEQITSPGTSVRGL